MADKRNARALVITVGMVKVRVKDLPKKVGFRARVEAAVCVTEQPR